MNGRSVSIGAALFAGLGLAATMQAAWAQIAPGQFAQNARRYLNQPVGLSGLYCYSAASGYECRTGEPLRIVTSAMPDGAAKSAMDNDCGELDGIEQSAACRFTLQLVPTEVVSRRGDFTRNGKQVQGTMTVVTVTVISAKKS